MIQFMWTVFLLVSLAGCALHTSPKTAESEEVSAPDMTGILQLIGKHSAAHGCPVAPRIALTNAHVIDLRPFDPEVPLTHYTYSDGDGHTGRIIPLGVERGRDLGMVEPEGEDFQHVFSLAGEPPAIGEKVWFLAYDYRSTKAAYAPRIMEVTVQRIVANHLILSRGGSDGSSGSCVLNAAGEVVAINAWRSELGMNSVGVAVGVWGIAQ